MTELRLNREMYDAVAIEEAVKVFQRFGVREADQQPSHWVIKIAATSEAREKVVSRELANYALGMTVKGRKVS